MNTEENKYYALGQEVLERVGEKSVHVCDCWGNPTAEKIARALNLEAENERETN